MTSRELLSSSSGCRGVARLKMGSIALTRQNKRSETGDRTLVCEQVTKTGCYLTFSRIFSFNNYDSRFILSGVQMYHSSSSTNVVVPAGVDGYLLYAGTGMFSSSIRRFKTSSHLPWIFSTARSSFGVH